MKKAQSVKGKPKAEAPRPVTIPQNQVLDAALNKIGRLTIELDIMRNLMTAMENENKQLKEQLKAKK